MCAVRVIDPSRSVPRYSTAASRLLHDLRYILKSRAASFMKFLQNISGIWNARVTGVTAIQFRVTISSFSSRCSEIEHRARRTRTSDIRNWITEQTFKSVARLVRTMDPILLARLQILTTRSRINEIQRSESTTETIYLTTSFPLKLRYHL